jgi:hypothetical protein
LLIWALYLASPFSFDSNIRQYVPAKLEPAHFYRGDGYYPRGLVRYSISKASADSIRTEGIAFLDREAGAGWIKTPIPIERFRPVGDCGGFWCSGSDVAQEATEWVTRPGSFARISGGNYPHVIIVNPSERALVLGYDID